MRGVIAGVSGVALLVAVAVVMWRLRQSARIDVRAELGVYFEEHFPEARLGESDGEMTAVQVGGQQMELNLVGLQERVRKTSDAEERRIEYANLVAVMREALESAQQPLGADEMQRRLLPRLVHPEYAKEMQRMRATPTRPVPGLDLVTAYVIDSERSVQFVTDLERSRLGVDLDRMHEIAMENLRAKTPADLTRRVLDAKGLVNLKFLDGYDATRLLLLPDMLGPGEALAAVIPDRDTLALLDATQVSDWGLLVELARIPLSERLLLDRPVLVTRGGFEVK